MRRGRQPDEQRGEVVKAFIILRQAVRADDALKKDIQDFVKRTTAPYKYPRQIDFVDELPKTITERSGGVCSAIASTHADSGTRPRMSG